MGAHLHDKKVVKIFQGIGGYKWSNNHYVNLILAIPPGHDFVLCQNSLTENSEQRHYGKRECSWDIFTGIVLKYAILKSYKSLDEIKKHKHFSRNHISDEDKQVIERFYSQHEFIYWDKYTEFNQLSFNNPFNNGCMFIKNKDDVPCLTVMGFPDRNDPSYSGISLKDALDKPTLREKFFTGEIVFYPQDCTKILEGLLQESPYKNTLYYHIDCLLSIKNKF